MTRDPKIVDPRLLTIGRFGDSVVTQSAPIREPFAGIDILPGAAIFNTVLSATMIGQGLDVQKKRRATAWTTEAQGAGRGAGTCTSIEEGEAR